MTIRDAQPPDAPGIARVHVESWRTTYPGIMPQEHLDALSLFDHEETWAMRLADDSHTRPCILVAETAGGEIVGFASGGPSKTSDPEFGSEIYALYLLQSHQGRGLGRRLTQCLARRLAENGHQTLLIWVNANNPARGFYEALGGVAARAGQREIKGFRYDDVGYGWDEDAFRRLIEEHP